MRKARRAGERSYFRKLWSRHGADSDARRVEHRDRLSFSPRVDIVAVEEIQFSEKVASREVESCPLSLRLSTFFLDSQIHNILHLTYIHVFCVARKNYDINARHARLASREKVDL